MDRAPTTESSMPSFDPLLRRARSRRPPLAGGAPPRARRGGARRLRAGRASAPAGRGAPAAPRREGGRVRFSGTTLDTLAADLARYGRTKSALHFDPARPLPVASPRGRVG